MYHFDRNKCLKSDHENKQHFRARSYVVQRLHFGNIKCHIVEVKGMAGIKQLLNDGGRAGTNLP